MLEQLITYDNIAIVLLVVAVFWLARQWQKDRKEFREREIGYINDGNERDRGYVARMEEQAMLTRQLTRGQIALGGRMKAIEKILRTMQAGRV